MITIEIGSAITILNAISTGTGAAIGTSPIHIISIQESDRLKIDLGDPNIGKELVLACINILESNYSINISNISIAVKMSLPPAKGMKTSSAVSTGVIAILGQFFNLKLSVEEIISLSAKASMETGVSITGAIDDAYACYCGGYWITNNHQMVPIKKLVLAENIQYKIIFLIPRSSTPKQSINIKLTSNDNMVLSQAKEEALQGHWIKALQMNSSIYAKYLLPNQEIINMISDKVKGVVGLNGAGPSLFLVTYEDSLEKDLEQINKNFQQYETVVTEFR